MIRIAIGLIILYAPLLLIAFTFYRLIRKPGAREILKFIVVSIPLIYVYFFSGPGDMLIHFVLVPFALTPYLLIVLFEIIFRINSK